jgi:HEAT repeat protein
LERALEDDEPQIQRHAARALGRIGDEDSLRVLLRNLYRSAPWAVGESVSAVGRIGSDAAVLPLLNLFQRTRQHWLREHIARTLSQLSGDESPEEILRILHESEKEIVDQPRDLDLVDDMDESS